VSITGNLGRHSVESSVMKLMIPSL